MADDVIDQQDLKNLYGDDKELIDDLFTLYREKSGGAIDYLENALKGGVAADIQLGAHRIKGVRASVCAKRAVAAALALEKHTATGATDQASALADALRAELKQVDLALKVTR